MNKDKILGMILSGGLSRRMGSDKTFKKISGVNLIQHTIKRSTKQVGRLIVNSNDSNKIFKHLDSTIIVKDCIPGNFGPLVGILSGIKWARHDSNYNWLVSFPVDSPFFPNDIVNRFIEESESYEILMAECSKRVHPVFSMWKVNIEMENQLEFFLNAGGRKIDEFTKKFKTRVVKFEEFGYDPFFNVNTVEDLKIANEIYNKYFKD